MLHKRPAVFLTIALALSLLGSASVEAKKPPKPPTPTPVPADQTPPAVMADFVVHAGTDDAVTLRWTAPGDDGTDGYATLYDVRYRVGEAVTDVNWLTSYLAWGEPLPARAGLTEQFTVIGLTEGTTYHFAAKAVDDVDNVSDISASVSATTGSATPGDWVKEIAFCRENPEDKFVCGTSGAYKGMDVHVDGAGTIVGLALGHGYPEFVERVGGVWTKETVDEVGVTSLDMAYSAAGVPAVSYRDDSRSSLVLATRAGGTWSIETVDAEAVDESSLGLAYDPDPLLDEPTIAYYALRKKGRRHYLRFARRTPSGWQTQNVAEAEIQNLALTYDPSGNPSIAYLDRSGTSRELFLARWDGSWQVEPVGSGSGPEPSGPIRLAHDPLTGDPVIIHQGDGLVLLRYDSATDSWDETQIAADWDPRPWSPGLAIDSSGVLYVSFFVEIPSDQREGNAQMAAHHWVMWSEDGGTTWGSQWLDGSSHISAPSHVAIDPQTDLPMIAYAKKPVRFAYVKPGVPEYPDGTPPDGAADLAANPAAATHSSVTLEWTAPGDDGAVGQADAYEARYALDGPVTEASWDSAQVRVARLLVDPAAFPSNDNIVLPAPAGSAESVEMGGLAAETTYYFGLKTRDEAGNWSALAAASATTAAAGAGDWAVDIVDPNCTGACGTRMDVGVDMSGRIGTWFADGTDFSFSTRDASASEWQHELVPNGVSDLCLAFGSSTTGVPWSSTCRTGPLEVLHKAGGAWVSEIVDQKSASGPTVLVVHPVTGEPHLTFHRSGVVQYAWRDGGAWHVEDVAGPIDGLSFQSLALHPVQHTPSIAFGERAEDAFKVWLYTRDGGSWSGELAAEEAPRADWVRVDLAYHPNQHTPAIVYTGYRNEGLHYRYRTSSGWSEAESFGLAHPAQTGGHPLQYAPATLAFGGDGTAYVGYQVWGDYDGFRIAARDGTGWSTVHAEAPTDLQFPHDAAVNPTTGTPLFSYGVAPPKIIELLPSP